jgi:hypothetical protein
VALVLVVAGCSHGSDFDRGAAIDSVIGQGHGTITRAQAECYVDRVRDELGTAPLAPDYDPPPDVVPRLTNIRIDCIGVTNLGTAPPATVDPDLSLRDALPNHRGDDPTLDALYDRCATGDGAACDQLFDQAPVGSEYETFASTCGNRRAQLRCADAYPSPSAAPTTVTPGAAVPAAPPAPVAAPTGAGGA